MKRTGLIFIAILITSSFAYGQGNLNRLYERSYSAWDSGDFITALEGWIELISGPYYAEYLEDIAQHTGELFHVYELTADGASPFFSPNGKYTAYRSGADLNTTIKIIDIDQGNKEIYEIKGSDLSFTTDCTKAVFIRLKESRELLNAMEEAETVRNAVPYDRQRFFQARNELNYQMALNRQVYEIDLGTGSEKKFPLDDYLINTISYSAQGSYIYFTGALKADPAKCELYSYSESTENIIKISSTDENVREVIGTPGGKYLIYTCTTNNPLPSREQSGRGSRSRGDSESSFIIHDLDSGNLKKIDGRFGAVSQDGSVIVYSSGSRDQTEINTIKLEDGLETVKVTSNENRIENPVLSPDGSTVAYSMMVRDDYEVFCIGSDGKDERQITREIQHDRFPQFVSNTRLIAAKGEGRHRRSYLYDLTTGKKTKLFHNNTVRTIAPEYEWDLSPDGSKLLIVSERDGDTISPERGVYLLDFNRKIRQRELLERLERSLQTERELRAKGHKMFEPVYDVVKSVTEQASVSKIYEYEKDLYDFDSKHISQPGNKLAGEYIFNVLKSFGYEPEYQWFKPRSRTYNDEETANVLAVLRGTENPEIYYVLSSHYDSNARCAGADDNNSGVAVLLEAARVMADHPLPASIVFAAFTGEEAGLLGSREYVRRAVESGMNLAGALNNDMIGWCNDHRLDNTIRYSNAGIRDIQHASAILFSELITYDAHYYKSTDAHAYYEAYGDIVGGIGSYPVLGSPFYHQFSDRLENISHKLIYETCKTTIASLMMLASSPSRVDGLIVENVGRANIELKWNDSPEKNNGGYIVTYRNYDGTEYRVTVSEPRIILPRLEAGTEVKVKAVNSKGVEGWDWSRIIIE
ncbi:M28 family peptidase [candidate division KSB1 bacterium]